MLRNTRMSVVNPTVLAEAWHIYGVDIKNINKLDYGDAVIIKVLILKMLLSECLYKGIK